MPASDDNRLRGMDAQGAAALLSRLLPRLSGDDPYDDSPGVAITEDHRIVISHEHARVLYETAMRSLPHCFGMEDGQTARDDCQMPDGVCHTCAAEGRSVPEESPVRRLGSQGGSTGA